VKGGSQCRGGGGEGGDAPGAACSAGGVEEWVGEGEVLDYRPVLGLVFVCGMADPVRPT